MLLLLKLQLLVQCVQVSTFGHWPHIYCTMITLYLMPESPPCRAVQMTAAQIGLEMKLNHLDLLLGEQLTANFASVNPHQKVPTIVIDTDKKNKGEEGKEKEDALQGDDGEKFILWESRAIITFLVDYYSPGNSLYPTNPLERARVDHMLHFDCATLYIHLSRFLSPLLVTKPTDPVEEQLFYRSLDLLDKSFLKDNPFAAGNSLTVADISLLASLSFAEAYELDFSPWPNVQQWMSRVKASINNYSLINDEAMDRFTQYMHLKKQAVKSEPVSK